MMCPNKLPTILTATLCLACACISMSVAQENSEIPRRKQGLANFFEPRPGETWSYKVERRLPRNARLSAEDEARNPSFSPAGYRVEFVRKRLCIGMRQPDGTDERLTCFDLFEDGVLKERELYEIGPEGLFGRGWARTDHGRDRTVLTEPIPIAFPRMEAGKSWEALGNDIQREFSFRVIERAEITVPAGTFEAARIQITSESAGNHLKHTIWFAENVGIVKEESVRSSAETVLLREKSELIDWHVPDPDAPNPYADEEAAAIAPEFETLAEYTVGPGDNVTRIARNFDVPIESVLQANQITDPDKIIIGMKLKIPKP